MDITKATHKNIIRDREEILRVFSLAYEDNTHHVNRDNYKTVRLEGYIRFDVLYFESDVISFSGLWTHDKWNDCARAADRYYIFKKYRSKTLIPNYALSAASKVFIPKQFKTAMDWGLSPFVSIQNIRRKKDINILKRRLKDMHNLDCVVLDELRYTCINQSGSQNCWQNILTLKSCTDRVDAALQARSRHNL